MNLIQCNISTLFPNREWAYWGLVIPRTVSRDNAVGIETGYRLDDRGTEFRVPVRARIFSSPRHPDISSGTPSLLSNGYLGRRGSVTELMQASRDAHPSPPTNAEVKNTSICVPTPPYVFMA
jgi:hypothetical protein